MKVHSLNNLICCLRVGVRCWCLGTGPSAGEKYHGQRLASVVQLEHGDQQYALVASVAEVVT